MVSFTFRIHFFNNSYWYQNTSRKRLQGVNMIYERETKFYRKRMSFQFFLAEA